MPSMTQTADQTQPGRKLRPTRIGRVTSDVRDKTITVKIDYFLRHPKYGKQIRRTTNMQVHDEGNQAAKGDTVEVMQCRPISKTKCWRLIRIVERAPRGAE
jgi:small subunit ribosomal protein S17